MFTNINSLSELADSDNIGFLYLFDASNYDNNISTVLEDTVKIGMTRRTIKERLLQYKIEPKNISFINCSEPAKRERLMKSFIKEILCIKPECGSEYFKGCRKEIEQVILYFALCDVEIIIKYYECYNNIEERIGWFKEINIGIIPGSVLENIKREDEKPEKQFSCEFCNSCFTLKRNLVQHLKTSKKCIQNRKDIIDISCIWCKLSFLTKEDLDKHYNKCSINKEAEHIYLIKTNELLLKEKDATIERLNNIIKDLIDKIKIGSDNKTIKSTTPYRQNPHR
jgi:hypothetical protein